MFIDLLFFLHNQMFRYKLNSPLRMLVKATGSLLSQSYRSLLLKFISIITLVPLPRNLIEARTNICENDSVLFDVSRTALQDFCSAK